MALVEYFPALQPVAGDDRKAEGEGWLREE